MSVEFGKTLINLVSDIEHVARFTDSNLVNPWGLVLVDGKKSKHKCKPSLWSANNASGTLTNYKLNGKSLNHVVNVPIANDDTSPDAPTGLVQNKTKGFKISNGIVTAPAKLIYVSENGNIGGFSPKVDEFSTIVVVPSNESNVYKDLTLAERKCGNTFLFATNFRSGFVDVYCSKFGFIDRFTDVALTDVGYAPFGIALIDDLLYVTFAKQDETKHDDVSGIGNGFVDVFRTSGRFVRRLINLSPLNSPWNVAKFKDFLLVSNFGNGITNVFDFDGKFIGPLRDKHGNIIEIGGLWSVLPVCEKLFITAGINQEANGLLGVIV